MVQTEGGGLLMEFGSNPWRKLVAFIQGEFKRCIVLVGGQSDGFFALNYHQQLVDELSNKGWTIVQALFTGWYAGYGSATLENDNEDMDLLLEKLLEKGMEEIVLFGHHTGAQDILFYMQNGQYVSKVSHVIFEGGLRNPAKMSEDEASYQKLARERALDMISEGRGSQRMPADMHPVPISANRFVALGGKHGVEDIFNPDQSEEEMAEFIGHLRVPVLIIFCTEADYRVKHSEKMAVLDKIQVCIDADVTTRWLWGGCDEHLNFLSGFEDETVAQISRFLQDEENKRCEREEESRREAEAESKRGRSVVYQNRHLKRSTSTSSISSIGSNR
jgi:hypothetical protein|eukprot:CAMPEP_0174284540 /NCGR_PEP_ID=MMETSP0809-20121228/5810_1 /TAXON_ID=73025 ORGANISM="Eutreptiella gymnastica-like, Strain CCMP1594" /NCGR_SAMPLE_ID=MMETSP0809 /ASSEMBLY_ACC=CAM_ASM_000658 /LENGTH=331 /DNA_ID=CAMNT_0015380077 /DNA_START=31 /DNA_END=1026 /DNA_ORIENTATION=-